jgi:hypothetical protein
LQFLDFLRDGAWQAIGAFLALFVSFLVYYLQLQRKELAFGVLSSRLLLTVAEEVSQRVKVTYDGTGVSKLRVILLGIKNSGTNPIVVADFERNIHVNFLGNGKVLSTEIVKSFPNELSASISFTEGGLELRPLLLNSGDYLIIKILYSGDAPITQCVARIAGISSTQAINQGSRLGPKQKSELLKNLVAAGFLGLVLLIGNYFRGSGRPEVNFIFVCLCIFIVGAFGWYWINGHITNSRRRYIDVD